MVTENTEPIEDGAQTQPVEAVTVPAESPADKTFTQDEVNRMMGQARRDARSQFSDYSELKSRAAKADELEQANLTEAERLEVRVSDAEKRATDAQEQVSSAMIASEVKVRATQMGIVDPDAAFLLLNKKNVAYNVADGVSGVDDALAQLLEDKPYLRAGNRTPNINPETGQAAPPVRLTVDQREAARLMNLTDEEYSQGL
jgi:FKBP-type peptidyl-prolyl cis-trans isomerase (trigger factor)